MLARAIVLLLVAPGCGGDGRAWSGTGAGGAGGAVAYDGCPPGERELEGECIAAGLPQEMACKPGDVPLADGSCIPAGVRVDGCGDGFVHDGVDGCDALLPAAACADGMMALPGDTMCREIAPCGSAPWGDIPADASTVYVDESHVGASTGSASEPFTTIQAGVDAAAPGAIVAVAAGNYDESVAITTEPVRLWGRCPSLVSVVGLAADYAAIVVTRDQTELRGLGVTGASRGVAISGAADIVIDSVRVHDLVDTGLSVFHATKPSVVTLTNSLLERVTQVAIYTSGSSVQVADVVVRDTVAGSSGGIGVVARVDTASAVVGQLDMRHSIVAGSTVHGVVALGGDVVLDSVLVRDTAELLGAGYGVSMAPANSVPDQNSSVAITRSVIATSDLVGVLQMSGDLAIEDVVVRDAVSDNGFGVVAIESSDNRQAPLIDMRHSTVRENPSGVGIEGHAVMEGIVVRDTTRGLAPLALQLQESKFAPAPSTLALSYSRFSNNARVALHFFGSDADVRATEIRDMPEYGAIVEPCIQVRTGVQNGTAGTFVGAGMSFENCRDAALLASAVDAELRDSVIIGGDLGRGVIVQRDPTIAGFSGALRLEGVSIEDSREFAVSAHATPLTMVGVRIARTAPESSGLFGDGVAVIALAGQPSPEAWISQTRVDDSTRAGLSSFGATVTLKNNAFVCQALELGVEPHVGYDAALIDDGGNFCGCPEATGACNASTTALTPPAPLDPIEP